MALRRQPELSWLSVFPIAEEVKDLTDPDRYVYVNVGGGIGHQCAEFKRVHPNVPGRVALEDLPHSIVNALSTEGVENIAHNFFEPQPIKGKLIGSPSTTLLSLLFPLYSGTRLF